MTTATHLRQSTHLCHLQPPMQLAPSCATMGTTSALVSSDQLTRLPAPLNHYQQLRHYYMGWLPNIHCHELATVPHYVMESRSAAMSMLAMDGCASSESDRPFCPLLHRLSSSNTEFGAFHTQAPFLLLNYLCPLQAMQASAGLEDSVEDPHVAT